MMYKALKPFPMSGKQYLIDDIVDVSTLSDTQIARLLKKRFIVNVDVGADAVTATLETALLAIPVLDKDEAFAVSLSEQDIVDVFTILQLSADDAIKNIAEINADNALILIHKIDSRKTVKEAAKNRASELAEAENNANNADNADNANGSGGDA